MGKHPLFDRFRLMALFWLLVRTVVLLFLPRHNLGKVALQQQNPVDDVRGVPLGHCLGDPTLKNRTGHC